MTEPGPQWQQGDGGGGGGMGSQGDGQPAGWAGGWCSAGRMASRKAGQQVTPITTEPLGLKFRHRFKKTSREIRTCNQGRKRLMYDSLLHQLLMEQRSLWLLAPETGDFLSLM